MKKIAVIEDDPDLFALLKYNLEKDRFQFVGATKGGGALDLCTRERPDFAAARRPCFPIPTPARSQTAPRTPAARPPARSSFLPRGSRNRSHRRPPRAGRNDYMVGPSSCAGCSRASASSSGRDRRLFPLKAAGLELDRPDQCHRLAQRAGRSPHRHRVPVARVPYEPPRRGSTRGQLLDSVWGHDRVVHPQNLQTFYVLAYTRAGRRTGTPKADPLRPRLRLQFAGRNVRDGAP